MRIQESETELTEAATVDIAILTALPLERDALLRRLEAWKAIQDEREPLTYYRGHISIPETREWYEVVLVLLLGMGNEEAAISTVKVLQRWQPAVVFLVGIAGGLPERVTLGDVVVADFVYAYAYAKQISGKHQRRAQHFPTDRLLYGRALAYEASEWRNDDTDFTIHGSAVRVCFRTRKLHIDLVPIIWGTPDLALPLSNVKNGGWIPRHDGWRWTSVTCHVDFVRRRTMLSKQVSGPVRFNKLVRLIKYWNNRQGNLKQSSYFCELVTAAALEKDGVTDTWQTSLDRIFSFLATNQLRQPIVFGDYYDPHSLQLPSDHVIVLDTVNPTNNLTSSWKEQKRQDYMRMAKQTYETVKQACNDEYFGHEDAAVQAWCQVFGEEFRHVQR